MYLFDAELPGYYEGMSRSHTKKNILVYTS